jgi:serine/threonine kinase 16
VDARTDVWSLGCLLFALEYGYSPFECDFATGGGDSGVVVVECGYLRVIGRMPEPPPSLRHHPPAVDALVARLCRKEPAERAFLSAVLEDVDAVKAEIDRAVSGGDGFADFSKLAALV